MLAEGIVHRPNAADTGQILTRAVFVPAIRPEHACNAGVGSLRLSKGTVKVLDWRQCPAVESVPGKVSGAWVFRGTRIPVSAVFENLEDGLTIDQIVQMFDGLMLAQVKAVLDFAAHSLEAPATTR